MNRMWKERFEGELNKINAAIVRKGGTKCYEKVVERTGRAIERYPSIARFYDIKYVRNEQKPAQMAEVRWKIKNLTGVQRGTGVYFLRTNMSNVDGRTAWDYYNLIREIEATNRQLKTDLNFRPMQPQKLVTTEAVNALGEKVKFRACSRPTKEAEAIYQTLGMRPAPFIKVKICSTQEPPG